MLPGIKQLAESLGLDTPELDQVAGRRSPVCGPAEADDCAGAPRRAARTGRRPIEARAGAANATETAAHGVHGTGVARLDLSHGRRTAELAGELRGFGPADYQNVAPPFPTLWVEWRTSRARQVVTGRRLPELRGVAMVSRDRPGGGWETMLSAFWSRDRGAELFGIWRATIAPDGSLEALVRLAPREDGDPARAEALENLNGSATIPALMAVAFSHCRNVRRVAVSPDKRLDRARVRRGKRPFVRFTTLVIDPMREVLRTEGGAEIRGLAAALHICRGHFKTYDERPLFGRLRGTFWWGDHVRGNAAEGVVAKDYAVTAPGQTTVGTDAPLRRHVPNRH